MSYITPLRQAQNLQDFAPLLGYKPASMAYILYKLEEKYVTFEIPKKNGGSRQISAPTEKLKALQSRLSQYLQNCLSELTYGDKRQRFVSHGFTRQLSIATNAQRHIKNRSVFNLDLEDFFPSLNFGRVRGFFIKNNNFKLSEPVATIIAQIACHDNHLPQGSPASPVISNLMANILDMRLALLARKNNCTYTRYADDLTFSTWTKFFPEAIARPDYANENNWKPSRKLTKQIESCGFIINKNKTRMQYADSRQEVTGLTVNKRVGVQQTYIKKTRAMVHQLITKGEFNIDDKNYNTENEASKSEGLKRLSGRLAFINQIDRFHKEIRKENGETDPEISGSRANTYADFLFFRDFVANDKPVILFEGKTDLTHIACALKSIGQEFSHLMTNDNGKYCRSVHLYNYTKTTKHILGLSGGTPNLAKFVSRYSNNLRKADSIQPQSPVIILLDNDSAAQKVISSANNHKNNNNSNKAPTLEKEDFYKANKNLYIVKIPKIGNKDTCIEDFFSSTTLSTVIDNKTFTKSNSFNPKNHYGKYVFSEKVVKKNRKSIDFSQFRPILQRIQNAISHFYNNQ